jgi:hypothetical protein
MLLFAKNISRHTLWAWVVILLALGLAMAVWLWFDKKQPAPVGLRNPANVIISSNE